LESPDTRMFALMDPRAFLKTGNQGIILDEIHRAPELLSYIQEMVDLNKNNVQYILTGSNQFSIMNKITQSLAGRTAIFKLLPLSINELERSNISFYTEGVLLNGFYPAIYANNLNPTKTYKNYYETYLERDLRQIINIKDLGLFQKFIMLCAGRIGNIFNASNISNEVGVSVTTIRSWISILETSFIVLLLQPYYENIRKRLIRSPKIYFYDVGLASYLLGIENQNQVSRDPLRGALFENMLLMELVKHRYNTGSDHNLFFYRDSHQNEIDIIIKRGHKLIPIEVKFSQTFNIDFLKGLNYINRILASKIEKLFLVYDGTMEQNVGNCKIVNFRHLVKEAYK
ncbi:MAG: ATP-binding protein, partial [Bacteroidales bacterium]|nr:ATP-binding protein [Bacteroidales bacterium]